jgi:hypothetical protein
VTQRIICIVAGQRAGTTALQDAVEATGAAVNYGEIFHTDPLKVPKPELMFMNFAKTGNIGIADIMIADKATAVVNDYLALLEADAQPKHVLIDVKFNSWPILSPAWRYSTREPFFFQCLKQKKAVFLFVWRENLAEQVLSNFILRKTGVTHNLDEKAVAGRKFEASIRDLKWLAIHICRSEAQLYSCLRGCPAKVVIKYEDLFHDGALTERFKTAVNKFVEIKFPDGRLGGIHPNAIAKRDIISNYDETVSAITEVATKHRRIYR